MDGMSAGFAGWEDITEASMSIVNLPSVSVAWRVQHKGRPQIEIGLNAKLMAQLGWTFTHHVRVLVAPDRSALALRTDPAGKKVGRGTKAGSLLHYLDWVTSPAQPMRRTEHRIESDVLVITLPDWARPATARAIPLVEAPPLLPPRPASPPGEVKFTPARDAVLRRMYPDWAPIPDILAAMNALPGAELTAQQVRDRAAYISLKRAGPKPEEGPALPAVAAPEPEPDPAVAQREARDTLFRKAWMDPALTVAEVLRQINALPGQDYSNPSSMYSLARRLGLPSQRPQPPERLEPETLPPLPPEPQPAAHPAVRPPAPPPAMTQQDRDKREVREMLAAGLHGRQIADDLGLSLGDVATWTAEWRREQAEAVLARRTA